MNGIGLKKENDNKWTNSLTAVRCDARLHYIAVKRTLLKLFMLIFGFKEWKNKEFY